MTFHDIRLAVRRLVLDRSVSAIVILCLAVGIGVNATLFSVIDGVLIQPLPFPEPDRLVVLNEISERRGIHEAGVSYPDLQDIRERATSLSGVAASHARVIALSDRAEAERVQGAAVHGLVVRQAAMLRLIGITAGLIGAFGITRVVRSLLYKVTPTDPLSFGGVTLFLVGIAVLASYLPARRATNVDPITALGSE